MLAAGICLLVASLFVHEEMTITGRAVAELIYLAIASNLAYVFWELAMRRGEIILVAACSYLTPLLSTVITCLYLGTPAGAKLWIGCEAVVAGAIVCKMSVKPQEAAVA